MAILLTFHILLIGTLLWIAVSAYSKLSAERAILSEFGLRSSLRYVVLLYPVAPLCLLIGTLANAPGIGGLLAFSCLIPGLVLAHQTGKRLETSGTDRTKPAAAAASLVTTGGVAGLIYVTIVVGLQALTSQLKGGGV